MQKLISIKSTRVSEQRRQAARNIDAWRKKHKRDFKGLNTTALIRSLREAHGRP